MSIFDLAELQLRREGKRFNFSLMLDRAKTIRHYLDMQERNKKVRASQLKRLAMAE